jgi:hypothetical protein
MVFRTIRFVAHDTTTGGGSMKRFGTLLVLLLIAATSASVALAERATRDEMTRVCQNWLTYLTLEQSAFSGSAQPQMTKIQEIESDGTLLGLVFSISPAGHIVVPVLKELQPVRAYSDETDVDMGETAGYPQLLRESLKARTDLYIATYGSLDAVQPAAGSPLFDRDYRAQWDELLVDPGLFVSSLGGGVRTEQAGPLLTTSWFQGSPYNDLCPGEGVSKTMAGCVAIAAAQIMNYHEWPPYGTGQHSYYWGGTQYCVENSPPGILSADFSDGYDWASMPDSCDNGCTALQNAAAAELCYEVGVAYESDYDCDGTGAFGSLTTTAMPAYFRYHDSVVTRNHSDYPNVIDWFKLIQEQINAGRPMLYTFRYEGPNAGHAVVCDGWRKNLLGNQAYWYHINYGWGGSYNAWFVVDHIAHTYHPVEEEIFFGDIEPNPITNTPLVDREADGNPYPVTAVFELPGTSLPQSFAVVYSTQPHGGGPISGPFTLTMTPTGMPNEYRAFIPAQQVGTDVHYYIKGSAYPPGCSLCSPVTYTDPLRAPSVQRVFLLYDDTEPPQMSNHTPLSDMASWEWPPQVQVYVYDYYGVESVEVEWWKNDVSQSPFPLTYDEYLYKYVGSFPGTVVAGDMIAYRIKAVDTSIHSNTSYLPPAVEDPYSFAIVDGITENFEPPYTQWNHSAPEDWCDGWHVTTVASHSPVQSWHFGSWELNDGYCELADGSLYIPEVILGAGAELAFWHSIDIAAAYIPHQGARAYDGGVLEISTDSGETWLDLPPEEGYDLPIISGTTGPFEPGRMVFGGVTTAWRQAHVDLSAHADEAVIIRFRFGSDAGDDFQKAGWLIDDVLLTPCVPVSPRDTASLGDAGKGSLTLGAAPNPFRPQTTISFQIASPGARVQLEIFDVTGRRVRQLMDGTLDAGVHSYLWDGRNQAGETLRQGIYFARIHVGDSVRTSKLLMLGH